MSEWLSYRAEDFLLFSESVYWRLFALHNEALWPAPVLAVAASAIILYTALRPSTTGGRIAGTLLALAWLSAGVLFLGQRYASINWAASYVAPFFVFQALLVAAVAWRGGLASGGGGAARPAALLMVIWAVALHPLLPLLDGRPLGGAELFGLAPDPTAIATLGFAVAAGGRLRWLLLPVPLLWCLASWATLDTMGTWEAWVPLAAAGLGLAAWLVSARRRNSP